MDALTLSVIFNLIQLMIIMSLFKKTSIQQAKLEDLKSAFLRAFPPPKPKTPPPDPRQKMKWNIKR